MRAMILIVGALAVLLALPGLALAQIASSSSSSFGGSFSTSSSIGRSDVLGALALGAGGRGQFDRDDVRALYATPFLANDACVMGARVRGGELVAVRARPAAAQLPLAQALLASEGALTQDALADAFEGRRDRYVLADCANAGALRASDALAQPCLRQNRGCALALVARLIFDANGIDAAERALVLDAFDR